MYLGLSEVKRRAKIRPTDVRDTIYLDNKLFSERLNYQQSFKQLNKSTFDIRYKKGNLCLDYDNIYVSSPSSSKKLTPSHGFPGIPGSNGMPGVPGVPGLQGQQGRDGEKGQTGDKGVQGLMGQKGDKGKQGSPGKSGAPGMTGIKGDKGDGGSRGIIGKPGEQGIKGLQGRKGDKGEKGESPTSVVSQSNWKQCVWKTSDSRNSGKIKV